MATTKSTSAAANTGIAGLVAACRAQAVLLALVLFFGLFVNILVLAGPIYALQVYDRVLSSRSIETLIALTILVGFLYLITGVLDYVRRRIAARIGERIANLLEPQVFARVAFGKPADGSKNYLIADMDQLRRFFGSALFVALIDLPWLPLFLIGIAVFHPILGWLCLIGALLLSAPLVVMIIAGRVFAGDAGIGPVESAHQEDLLVSRSSSNFGTDMAGTIQNGWRTTRRSTILASLAHQDRAAAAAAAGQTFRMMLQSAVIAVGAYLVLHEQLTIGAIIATSVMLARALGPIDLIAQNVGSIRQTAAAAKRLASRLPFPDTAQSALSQANPGRGLAVNHMTVFAPDAPRAVLRMVNFDLAAGQSLGIHGASGSGKTALAHALTANWPIAGGSAKIAGVLVHNLSHREIGKLVGYLPQVPTFLKGTVGDIISGFDAAGHPGDVVSAVEMAGAVEIVEHLPQGYQTVLDPDVQTLSGGQHQRIALARALYGTPPFLIFDEPENHCDARGLETLKQIIVSAPANGTAVIVLSQHQETLANCQRILHLDRGAQVELLDNQPLVARSAGRPTIAKLAHSKRARQ